MSNVAVIGAGPMGLACAYSLLQAGHTVQIFEADDRIGGMSSSFDFDGVNIERYYHFINSPDTVTFGLLRDLGLEKDLRWQATKMGFFRQEKDGHCRLHPWGNPIALLKMSDISLLTRMRYGLHAFYCKYIKNLDTLDDMSAADWIRRWEGDDGYDKLWRFLFEKKFFHLAEPLSAAWLASRIRRVAKSRVSLMEERMGYLEGGSSSLLDSLAAEIASKGGEIHLSTPVSQVLTSSGKVTGVMIAGRKEAFEVVISTIPLPYLGNLVPALPSGYTLKQSQVKNVGCACALFRLAEPLTENFWLNIDVPHWNIPGIIEYSNLRPMAKAYVYVPFYMPHDHPNWHKKDVDILTEARGYLHKINPTSAATEENAVLFRYEYAQPVCPPEFQRILPPYKTGISGFFAADTSHSYPEDRSINESVRIGQELASEIVCI